jgi:hypothetical protein
MSYFKTNNEVHRYNTRKISQLHKSYNSSNYVKHTLSNKGVDIWNGLKKNTSILHHLSLLKNTSYRFTILKTTQDSRSFFLLPIVFTVM